MDRIFKHELMLLLGQLFLADDPRICISNLFDLLIEGIGKLPLNFTQASSSSRVRDHTNVREA